MERDSVAHLADSAIKCCLLRHFMYPYSIETGYLVIQSFVNIPWNTKFKKPVNNFHPFQLSRATSEIINWWRWSVFGRSRSRKKKKKNQQQKTRRMIVHDFLFHKCHIGISCICGYVAVSCALLIPIALTNQSQ